MFQRPNCAKIPGDLPKSNADKYVQNLSKLTKSELIELQEREQKLLSNKGRILKLPDKGKRIQDFYDKIQKELLERDEIENAANMFSELNIASRGKIKLNQLEWTGKYDSNQGEPILDSDDDDDDEIDPFKILAQSTTATKKVKYIKSEIPLITEEDIKEINSFNDTKESVGPDDIVNIDKEHSMKTILGKKLNGSLSSQTSSTNSIDLEPYSLYLMEKSEDHNLMKKVKYLPHKTTKTNVHDPEKEILRKKGKHWENTAATPPPIIHAGTKMLSLQDSVEIQIDYLDRLKKLQEKQAQERLTAKMARMAPITLPEESTRKMHKFFGTYRDEIPTESSDSEIDGSIDSDEGVRDDEDDKGGAVSYTVYN